MKCSYFSSRLTAFLRDEITAEEREAVLAHLECCPDCRQTVQIGRGDWDLEPPGSPGSFVSAVLELTSGPTCQSARRQLCDFVDGLLNPEASSALAGHLQRCRDCSALFVALTELAQVLPEMALLSPDPAFAPDLLSLTSSRPPEVSPPRHPIRSLLERLFRRPRFSLEAAYVGTLLILAVWGNIATPFVAEQSPLHLASIQVSLRRIADKIHERIPEESIREHARHTSQEIINQYLVWKGTASGAVSLIRVRLDAFQAESSEQLRKRTDAVLALTKRQLQVLREELPLGSNADQRSNRE